jgi:hypothetical protein
MKACRHVLCCDILSSLVLTIALGVLSILVIFISVNLFIWVLKCKDIKVRVKFFTVNCRNWYLMCTEGTSYRGADKSLA